MKQSLYNAGRDIPAGRCIGSWLLLLLVLLSCPNFLRAQDILGLFMQGDGRARMMGGDPFSVLNDSATSSEEAGGTVSFGYRADNYFREENSAGEQSSGRQLRSLAIDLQVRDALIPLGISLRHNSQTLHAGSVYPQDDGDAVGAYDSRGTETHLGLNMQLAPKVTASVGAINNTSGGMMNPGWDPFGNMRFSLTDRFWFSISAAGNRSGEAVRLRLDRVDGIIPIQTRMNGWTASLGLLSGQSFPVAVTVELGRDYLHGSGSKSAEGSLQGIPTGWADRYSAMQLTTVSSRVSVMMQWRYNLTHVDALLRDGDSPYGQVQGFQWFDRSVIAAVHWKSGNSSKVISSVAWRSVGGGGGGYVETWPFVSVFESIVPVREYFSGTGRLDLVTLHAGYEHSIARQTILGIGLHAVHCTPSLWLDTWQPKFLIFGTRAFRHSELDITSLDLGILSAGLTQRIGRIELCYSISQMIPLHVGRKEVSADNTFLPQTGVGTGNQSSGGNSSGGQFHFVTVTVDVGG